MAFRLGIDTGGTYTDAVLFDPDQGVVAAAKALTTKHDLTIGVREAVERVLGETTPPIGLVGLSTTLATNALVEGHGGPVALVLIGFGADALQRADLNEALRGDPVLFIDGGHDASGMAQAPLDEAKLLADAAAVAARVDAFAVTGHFAVRNPAHERRAAELLASVTGKPVTSSHELTARLDGTRRALTTLLNARLIGDIHRLIEGVRGFLIGLGITAPLMVTKGDGSLVTAATALRSPVETILSGPAASVVGAAHLSGLKDVMVSDIGGTTTDIAFLKNGRPELDAQGARVGRFRTMVEAIAVHTSGLGGDSETRRDEEKRLVLGPRRAMPLSLLAHQHPAVLAEMKAQLERPFWRPLDGMFALRLRALPDAGTLPRLQREVWDWLEDGPLSLDELCERRHAERPLARLVDRGLVIRAAFTPSDAAHVLGLQSNWNGEGARLGAALRGRYESLAGKDAGLQDPEQFARTVVDLAVRQTARALLNAAFAEDGFASAEAPAVQTLLDKAVAALRGGLVRPRMELHLPVVAIGAPARLFYPEACRRLGTEAVIPPFAHVSNAVGAVAGDVVQHATVTIGLVEHQRLRVHRQAGPYDTYDLADALSIARAEAERQARSRAEQAGAGEIAVRVEEKVTVVDGIEGGSLFVEAVVTATASGRPGLA
ncbi:MAG TPA: hydantoinase/oxoprolinase family protein [Geminicoccus sp.]|uniref:hydantoinase/oxoprolinase family protein n=1 Tax=Geminicoccus sp. TaxID=2024832 RepID=UPI002E337F49|nr:hydantoinase/oxoprolinase family protein [Geminicoccus sp.]HEX2526193.1 hydantoinase/oxoprolinase family protein [Geminicoccus sp.]